MSEADKTDRIFAAIVTIIFAVAGAIGYAIINALL